ncbi:MAG: hypothetical protein U9Q79_12025, partial [Candidatus Hydrogenedentes bacterium]|nr:hypothetical protein [Candidatus Hydrogenedentota bacterium]
MVKKCFMVAITAFLTWALCAVAELPVPKNPLWEPIVDEAYLQEVASHIETENPLNAVAVFEGKAYVGDARGVAVVEDDALKRLEAPIDNIARLKVLDNALWAASPEGLAKFDGSAWSLATDMPAVDMCLHNGQLVFASGRALYTLANDSPTPLSDESSTNLLGIAPYSGTVYVHDGKRVGLLERGHLVYEEITDWGSLEHGCTIRDIMSYGSRLYFATDEGLCLLRGMTWYHIVGEDGLCYEDTTCLARGFDRDLWIGTMRGGIRNVDGEYQFLGYPRWIPHDKVNAIACGDNVTYLATDGGLGIITYEPYTLAKKAAYYERWLDEWGQKRLGFIHSLFLIDGKWQREVSDNDVGYSSHYLHAKCFEYAVTGNAETRAEAVNMMKSMKWSEEITPIDGFPARSIYAAGEPCVKAQHGSGGLPAEWHPTPDGVWEWKGDTSS